jgi:hypothetical protein
VKVTIVAPLDGPYEGVTRVAQVPLIRKPGAGPPPLITQGSLFMPPGKNPKSRPWGDIQTRLIARSAGVDGTVPGVVVIDVA